MKGLACHHCLVSNLIRIDSPDSVSCIGDDFKVLFHLLVQEGNLLKTLFNHSIGLVQLRFLLLFSADNAVYATEAEAYQIRIVTHKTGINDLEGPDIAVVNNPESYGMLITSTQGLLYILKFCFLPEHIPVFREDVFVDIGIPGQLVITNAAFLFLYK